MALKQIVQYIISTKSTKWVTAVHPTKIKAWLKLYIMESAGSNHVQDKDDHVYFIPHGISNLKLLHYLPVVQIPSTLLNIS
jgi:hypothetical protein